MKPFLNSYQRNNKLVWDATVQTMNGLFNEVWEGKDTISVDHAVEITLPVWVFFSSPVSVFFIHTEILNFRLLSLSLVLQVIPIFCLFSSQCSQIQMTRIWAKNVMAPGKYHTKGTPDVDERGTPHGLNRNSRQGYAPRLEFETYKASTKHQDCL
jgi:hypothetical protein